MRTRWNLILCLAAGASVGGALAQTTPEDILTAKPASREGVYPRTPDGIPIIPRQVLWDLAWATRESEATLKQNIVQSETAPHRMARTVLISEAMVERSKGAVRGEYIGPAGRKATLEDRIRASEQLPPTHRTRNREQEVMEAAFRRLFEYRQLGFAKKAEAYFLAVGSVGDDAPRALIDRLQEAANAGAGDDEEAIAMLPFSRGISVSRVGVRDRMTGKQGPIFRVGEITPLPNGDVRVAASFSERDGFFFTKEFVLSEGDEGWRIVSERDYPVW